MSRKTIALLMSAVMVVGVLWTTTAWAKAPTARQRHLAQRAKAIRNARARAAIARARAAALARARARAAAEAARRAALPRPSMPATSTEGTPAARPFPVPCVPPTSAVDATARPFPMPNWPPESPDGTLTAPQSPMMPDWPPTSPDGTWTAPPFPMPGWPPTSTDGTWTAPPFPMPCLPPVFVPEPGVPATVGPDPDLTIPSDDTTPVVGPVLPSMPCTFAPLPVPAPGDIPTDTVATSPCGGWTGGGMMRPRA